MIFTFFTVIVFIAELIIALTVILSLLRFDIAINKTIELIEETRPKIKDVCELFRKISEQIYELTPIFIEQLIQKRDEIILTQLKSLMASLIFCGINIKIVKKIRKSKPVKILLKGLSLVQNMI